MKLVIHNVIPSETCRPSAQNVAQAHLADPVDRRLAKMIGRSMQIPGRHGFEVLFREFMQRGYEAAARLPKGGR